MRNKGATLTAMGPRIVPDASSIYSDLANKDWHDEEQWSSDKEGISCRSVVFARVKAEAIAKALQSIWRYK
jgi:hypothetical protein